jgi:hypothetical protein
MEPLIHYVIPVLFILALNQKLDRRKILRYSLLTLLPDMDFFLGHALLHNIFMPLALSSIVYHLAGRDKSSWMLSTYFLYSHLILDLGFVALLYPIEDSVFSLKINIYTSPKVAGNIWNIITGQGAIGKEAAAIIKSKSEVTEYPLEVAKNAEVSPVFTQIGLMLILIYLLTIALNRFSRRDTVGGQ